MLEPLYTARNNAYDGSIHSGFEGQGHWSMVLAAT
jgi:hypothetical protein